MTNKPVRIIKHEDAQVSSDFKLRPAPVFDHSGNCAKFLPLVLLARPRCF